MKLWGGRFEGGPSEVFERFSESLSFDRRLIEADVAGSKAFARALERVGVLTAEERAQIADAFDAILKDAAEPGFFDGATDEDIHTLVIRKLGERAGAVADKIHTGRSRNEQVSLDTRLWVRAEIRRAQALLVELMAALVELAGRYPEAVRGFQLYLTKYPDGPRADSAAYWLGEANYVQKEYQAALVSYLSVLQKYPDSKRAADAQLKVGFCQYELKAFRNARATLEKVVSGYPGTEAARLATERLTRMDVEKR